MRCFHPVNIGSWDEPFYVPCGKCVACRHNHRKQWSLRLTHELQGSKTAHFVTLTYNDEHLKFFNELTGEETSMPSVSLRDVQLFFKRLRKSLCAEFGKDYRIRYYLTSEYGPTYHRPHYHAIIFGLPAKNPGRYIDDAWQQGFVKVDPVTDARIRYVTKYCLKDKSETMSTDADVMPVFSTMSRRPFLGSCFVFNKANMAKYDRNPETCMFLTLKGFKYAFPRTYLNVYLPKDSIEREERTYRIQALFLDKQKARLARLAFLEETDPAEFRRLIDHECNEEKEMKAAMARQKRRSELDPRRLKSIQVS